MNQGDILTLKPYYLKKNYLFLFIWLCQVLVAACGIYFPDQGLNLHPDIGSVKA